MGTRYSVSPATSFVASGNASNQDNRTINPQGQNKMTIITATTTNNRYNALDFSAIALAQLVAICDAGELLNITEITEAKSVTVIVAKREIQFVSSEQGFWRINIKPVELPNGEMQEHVGEINDTHKLNGILHALTAIYTGNIKHIEPKFYLYHSLDSLDLLDLKADEVIGGVRVGYKGKVKIDGLNLVTGINQVGRVSRTASGELYVSDVFTAVPGVFGEDWDEEKTARDHERNAVNLSLGCDYISRGFGVSLKPLFKEYTKADGTVRTHKEQVADFFNYYLNALSQSTMAASRALVADHKKGKIMYRLAGQVKAEMAAAVKSGTPLAAVETVKTKVDGKTSVVPCADWIGKAVTWLDSNGVSTGITFPCKEQHLKMAEVSAKKAGMYLGLA